MSTMVPRWDTAAVSLADVVPSSLAAIANGGRIGADLPVDGAPAREGRITLAPVRAVVLVLVDGLGANALASRSGHARFLGAGRRRLRSGFPTTTAAALSTLTTGVSAGSHGVVGYSGVDPATNTVLNMLGGWDDEVPAGWLRVPTLFTAAADAGIRVVAVGPKRYHSSGFTRNVLGGSAYVDADTLAARVDASLDAVGPGAAPTLVYCYYPELDSIAHKHGWGADRWTDTLERLDAELARMAAALPADVGMIVTADHGVLDVPDEANVTIDPELLADVVAVAGDPRCRQLTVAPGTDVDALVGRFRDRYGKRAWVASRDEAIAAGWFGAVDDAVRLRIGDVVLAARGSWAFNDDRAEQSEHPKRMVGQHGSMSDDEAFVPLVLAGAFRA